MFYVLHGNKENGDACLRARDDVGWEEQGVCMCSYKSQHEFDPITTIFNQNPIKVH